MSGHQISFLEFAASRQALCTPPAESSPNPSDEAGLVAHPSVGGGECTRFIGSFSPSRSPSFLSVRNDAYHPDLAVEWACGGMDAPRDLPKGCHSAFASECRVYSDGFLLRREW